MPNVNLLEPSWPDATTAGVVRQARNHAIAPGAMDSLPTANVDYAGALIYVPGATTVADQHYLNQKDAADAQTLQRVMTSRRTVVDTGGAFATPIVLTAADSGKIYLMDDAAGLDFTLPALSGAATNGINYTFFVTVTNTSNSYRLTAQTGDLMRGHVLISDFDAAYTAPQILMAEADGSDDLVLTMAAIAQGGGVNGWLEITAIHATGWFVRGNLSGDGTIVTTFS